MAAAIITATRMITDLALLRLLQLVSPALPDPHGDAGTDAQTSPPGGTIDLF